MGLGPGHPAVTCRLLGLRASDPLSGFFMIRRSAFNEVALNLQQDGFKILADMLSASGGRWKVLELSYAFHPRSGGLSKMDSAIVLEFLGLLISRITGGMVPVRFAI